MGERKVLNKYFPPDFDPAIIPKGKKPPGRQITVRIMLPMSVQCNTCHEYVYRGKKFNGKQEEILGGDYLGIKVYRFYFKCPNCVAEIAFRTDPENADYIVEIGATRNFELWRTSNAIEKQLMEERDTEEADTMRKLELRTLESKLEMEEIDALEEIREVNAGRAAVDTDALIQAVRDGRAVVLNDTMAAVPNPDKVAEIMHQKKLTPEEEEEEEVRKAFENKDNIKRLDSDDEEATPKPSLFASLKDSGATSVLSSDAAPAAPKLTPVVIVKKRKDKEKKKSKKDKKDKKEKKAKKSKTEAAAVA